MFLSTTSYVIVLYRYFFASGRLNMTFVPKCLHDQRLAFATIRFKGDKEKGPAPQRIRDDSAVPQIQEVATASASTLASASSKSKVSVASPQTERRQEPAVNTPLTVLQSKITVSVTT